jgi:hypothetical protein
MGELVVERDTGQHDRQAKAEHEEQSRKDERANGWVAINGGLQGGAVDARHLPIADGTIDRAVSNLPWGRQVRVETTLDSFYRQTLTELARVLAPGGTVTILTNAPDSSLVLGSVSNGSISACSDSGPRSLYVLASALRGPSPTPSYFDAPVESAERSSIAARDAASSLWGAQVLRARFGEG